MIATIPASHPELPPSLVRAAIAAEPELGRLFPADELNDHLTRFIRALRRSAEREAISQRDPAT